MNSSLFRSPLLRIATPALAALLTASCAGPAALRTSYVQYSDAFATTSNQQVLLNLARMRNYHPPHFLQMGSVTAQFSFSGGLTGGYSSASIDAGTFSQTVGKTFGLTFAGSESPVFNFTPLSGGDYGKKLLTPTDPKLLYAFANQNFPVSQVLRVMVDRVVVTYDDGTKITLSNKYNPLDPDNYADFLRLAANLAELQSGDLLNITAQDDGNLDFTVDADRSEALRKHAAKNPSYKIKAFAQSGAKGSPKFSIRSRSLLTILFAVSTEALVFDSLPRPFLDALPENEREPVLRIDADPAYTAPPAAEVDYAGKHYVISDKTGSARNRDTFMLLQMLASQSALDPSQLPVQQLIQVR